MAAPPAFDVAVVGAGPIGSALALMLARRGLRSILIDKEQFPRDKPCGEGLMPSGAAVLEELGLDLSDLPRLEGVSYHLPGRGTAIGTFPPGRAGRGVRRLEFDARVAEMAARSPLVQAEFGCRLLTLEVGGGSVGIETSRGSTRARVLVGADGQHSSVARLMGWPAEPRGQRRHALVGHLEAPGHGAKAISVTLLEDCEVYMAPTAHDELLVAVLAGHGHLRRPGESVLGAYRDRLAEAHPGLEGCSTGKLRGAGPFRTRPPRIASERIFLVGDAAGFLDPLTGDGLTAGLLSARYLADRLARFDAGAAHDYRKWERVAWWRRSVMSRLTLSLTGSSRLAARALAGLRARPSSLDRLLQVNEGSRPLRSLSPADWAALAGL